MVNSYLEALIKKGSKNIADSVTEEGGRDILSQFCLTPSYVRSRCTEALLLNSHSKLERIAV